MGAETIEKPRRCFGILHLQATMIWIANILAAAMRVNMNLAIVAMTDKTKDNTFDWSLSIQSTILSSLQWGLIVAMLPAGELITRFGGMTLLCLSVGFDSLVCVLMPTAATYGGWQAVIAMRVFQGMAQGFHYPSFVNLISKWVPLDQKARLSAFILSGNLIGMAVQFVTSGYIADAWGWQGIFYLGGVLGLIWTLIYVFIGASSPESSKLISIQERAYIQNSLNQVGKQKRLRTPWKDILMSVPVWTLVISCVGFNWGFNTLLTQTPTYMSNVLDVDIKSNGVLSALQYMTLVVFCYIYGFISDYLTTKKIFHITTCRKIFNSIASFGHAIFLIIVCYAPADTTIFVTLLCASFACSAAFFSGDYLVYLDLSPNFASILVSISQFCSNTVSFNAPLVASLIVKDEKNADQWHNVFYLAVGVYVITNIIFLILGTSETQKWNTPPPVIEDAENEDRKDKV